MAAAAGQRADSFSGLKTCCPVGQEVVLDAYSQTALCTIGLTASGRAKQGGAGPGLAPYRSDRQRQGAEAGGGTGLNQALSGCHRQRKHNNVKNARFFAAAVDASGRRDHRSECHFHGKWSRQAEADVVSAPPIALHPSSSSVARMAPKRVVYVSCNPETMARDLALLTAKGYRAEGFTPVDLFPQTAHCEVVGALTRSQKSKG